jgi:type IV pilus assembly protein PilP
MGRAKLAIVVPALLAACLVSLPAAAACKRINPSASQGKQPPQLDGPGSFGPLHGTVTLDCLKYVGSIEKDGVEHVMIRDEQGTVHRLKVGDYMGENGGVISRIDDSTIYINQRVKRDGKWKEVVVRFPKK